jgi:hypothetical protein
VFEDGEALLEATSGLGLEGVRTYGEPASGALPDWLPALSRRAPMQATKLGICRQFGETGATGLEPALGTPSRPGLEQVRLERGIPRLSEELGDCRV